MKGIGFVSKVALLGLGLLGSIAWAEVTVNDPLPTEILSCGGTKIVSLQDRFGGVIGQDENAGSSVNFSNGGQNISYSVEPVLKNSRVGDHILMCLVFIPKNCPKDDVRGRIYTITNLRTLESVTLPDSQHSCRGA